MSQLKNKSVINIAAAYEMQKQSFYCSSVHSSYYSCIQLMLHLIIYKIGIDQAKIADEHKKFKLANPMASAGLHEYYINLILGHLRGKKLDANAFNKEIFKLKKTRTAADYLDIGIGPDECRYSIQQAEEITKILTKAL